MTEKHGWATFRMHLDCTSTKDPTSQDRVLHLHQGSNPQPQACTLTGNQTRNFSGTGARWHSNQLSHTGQGTTGTFLTVTFHGYFAIWYQWLLFINNIMGCTCQVQLTFIFCSVYCLSSQLRLKRPSGSSF